MKNLRSSKRMMRKIATLV